MAEQLPGAKRPRVELPLLKKIELIKQAETLPKPSLKTLGERFGIGKTTVSDILKRKLVYKEEYERNSSGAKYRVVSTSKYGDLNELVWKWFCQARTKNIPISGPIVQEKAMQFAEELQLSDFKGSNGWLDKWKGHYNIKSFKVSGESASVDVEVVANYQERLPTIIGECDPSNIFNCDETGLYFRALPDKTLCAKGQSSKGVKAAKDRVTVMLACSAVGEKLKPLVIGKAKNPRCFKNINVSQLPVHYTANQKAWMTSHIFLDWIGKVNKMMMKEKRHILLFLDNATSHAQECRLSNVTLKFFPANCTSVLQPLDHGIIRAFKARYHKHMLRSLLSKMDTVDNVQALCKEVNLLDAIHWTDQSWTETASSTIVKCFCETGFPNYSDVECTRDESGDIDDDIGLPELAQELQIELDEHVDDDVPTEDNSEDWERALVDQFKNNEPAEVESDDNDEIETESVCDMTYEEVLKTVQKLKTFALIKDGRYLPHIQALESLTETQLAKLRCQKKQSTLDSFISMC